MRELIDIVTQMPEIASESGRLNFLKMTLYGLPKISSILLGMNLAGAPAMAAREIVFKLRDAGSYTASESYLLQFVKGLGECIFDAEQKQALQQISEELGGKLPTVAPRLDAAAWRGKDAATDYQSFKERVIGEDTLRPFYYVRLAVEAGAAVCRISVPAGTGTGFLIAPNLVMTNNHVLPSAEDLAQAELWFRYEQNPNGTDAPVVLVKPIVGGLFRTDPDRDVSIFEIEPLEIAPLRLASVPAKEGDRAAIIQHPAGMQKKISLQNNKVQYADKNVVDYTTTTLPGSSGSPVLNDLFEVIALHREGGNLQVPGTNLYYYRNRGTSATALRAWLTENDISLLSAL
jgi:S1-C subfamily serine protease